jgi:membrane associated rhomboid family serine protease
MGVLGGQSGRGTHPSPTPPRALVTGALIIAQLAVWLVVVFCYRDNEWLEYALVPRAFGLPRLLVSPFVHLHPFHLGFNLLVLWVFGSSLERAIGPVRFLAIYLGAGWFVGLMHWAVTTAAQTDLDLEPTQAAIGAIGSSGAVAGVLGACCVRLPHRPLRFPLLAHWPVPPALLLGSWLGWEFVQAVLSTARGTGAGIGHWAHFAGFIFGLSAAYLFQLQRPARAEQLGSAASAASQRGDLGAAAEAWSERLSQEPDDRHARQALIEARLGLDDAPAAEGVASEGLARAVRAGHAAAAIEDYLLFLQLLPDLRLSAGVRYRIGCWLAEAGQPAAAVAALLVAAREDAATPGAAAALFRAGEIAADRLHDPRRARSAWQRILLDYPESAYRDRAYERLGQLGRTTPGVTEHA